MVKISSESITSASDGCPTCVVCATFTGDARDPNARHEYEGHCASMGANSYLGGQFMILTKDATADQFHLDELRPEIMVPKFEEGIYLLKRRLHIQFVKRFGILFGPNIVSL